MNILVIGNGFDLAHNLPTSYVDFLLFCEKAETVYTANLGATAQDFCQEILTDWETDSAIKQVLIDAFNTRHIAELQNAISEIICPINTSNKELDELYSCIQNNIWLKHFRNLTVDIGNNWIDFESEIARVVKILDEVRLNKSKRESFKNLEKYKLHFVTTLWEMSNPSGNDPLATLNNMDQFISFLNLELEKLIRALEIYLAGFVNRIPITSKSVDIESIHPDCLLSFNYTNTYERIYGASRAVEYDYIHGKADLSKNVSSCNMVLGIDEYLDNSRKDTDLEFLPFKKYYQRIYKSTGNRYLNWVDKIKDGYTEYLRKVNVAYSGNPDPLQRYLGHRRYYDLSSIPCPQHTLYIFGHSLDVTDKDILKLLICNENVQTKIYYYRKNADDKTILGKLIKNLVRIMGQDELIRRTGGTHKTIEFIPQELHGD